MILRHTAAAVLALAVSSVVSPVNLFDRPALAADAAPAPTIGVVNEASVYVRSGAGDVQFYATARLTKGTKVTVLGSRNDWAEITPPDGSFFYVNKGYLQRIGDAPTARVIQPVIHVRAGSSLNTYKTTVIPTALKQGDDVQVIGEVDDFWKIAPPPGAVLYVKRESIDLLPPEAAVVAPIVPATPVAVAPVVPAPVTPAPIPVEMKPAELPAQTASAVLTTSTPAQAAPSTQPTETAAVPSTQPVETAVAPTTRPVETAQSKFGATEAAFYDATKLPLDKQPIESLTASYTELSASPDLTTSVHRIIDRRIATLKLRADARDQYASAMKMQADAVARRQAAKAEHDELSQRLKDQSMTMYAAVGTLRLSSLQQAGGTLYRLTDPGTGRTLLYVKTNDPKYAGLLNQFVGVKGDVTTDDALNLKLITPTDGDAVDQNKVGTTIGATILPPSMVTKTANAG